MIILRHLNVAVRALVLATLVLGLGYPLLVTGSAHLLASDRADGALVEGPDGRIVGSALLGQRFSTEDGEPLARYFQPRPSAAGDGYDGLASGGSNLGPESAELAETVRERRAEVARTNGVKPDDVPADAVTASGSGLDPHISADYALLQVPRVAEARDVAEQSVRELVERRIESRAGILGEPRVNVLDLNLALDRMKG